jgi:nucleotide-binding universal stress UspA family protein
MLFSKIVVAVDGSESSNKVYDVAAQLAKLSKGKLIIVHVVMPPLPVGGSLFYSDISGIDKIRIDLEEAGRRLLQNYFEKSINEYKIEVETTLAQGYPPDAIIREADAKGADLIVIGSRGFSGVKQFFIGSVPNSILHHSYSGLTCEMKYYICIKMLTDRFFEWLQAFLHCRGAQLHKCVRHHHKVIVILSDGLTVPLLIQILDLFGTMTFAVTGAFRAIEHRSDIVGIIILATIAGVAGGVLRDIVFGRIPPLAVTNPLYLIITVTTAVALFPLWHAQKTLEFVFEV